MAENSKIQWTDHTFNPWRGCTKVSPGCAHCYAEAMSRRNPSTLGVWGDGGTRVIAAESYWRQPLKWDRDAAKAGERRRVFCASLADVFEDRPELVAPRVRLFHLISETRRHLDWLLLTKRPENIARFQGGNGVPRSWPENMPTNVWLGVSVEDQQRADERISLLLQTPAAVRFLSCEPLLGPVDLTGWAGATPTFNAAAYPERWADFDWPAWVPADQRRQVEDFWASSIGRSPRQWAENNVQQKAPATGARVGAVIGKSGWGDVVPAKSPEAEVVGLYLHCWNNIGRLVCDDGRLVPVSSFCGTRWLSKWLQADGSYRHRLHWVIVGGESGPHARPCHVEWVRSLRDQCKAAGVACFVKQLGAHVIGSWDERMEMIGSPPSCHPDSTVRWKLRDPKGGDPAEWSEDLRVREFPVSPAPEART